MFAQSKARMLLSSAARLSVKLGPSSITKPSPRSDTIKQGPSHTTPPTTARKKRPSKPAKPAKPGGTYCTFPSLHNDVSALLEGDDLNFGFHDKDDPTGCIKEYSTTIMGNFVCRNVACSCKGWHSMMIAITIRMYPDTEYNARVYKQRCQRCNMLGDLLLERGGSYAERVAYRIKKWCGVETEPPPYQAKDNEVPHRSDLCEGCKAGHCKEGGLDGFEC